MHSLMYIKENVSKIFYAVKNIIGVSRMLVVSPRTGRGGRWAPRSQSSSSWPGVVLVVRVGQVGRGSVGECWRMCVAGAGAARGGARAAGAGARAGAGPGRSTRRGGGPPAAPTRRGSWS